MTFKYFIIATANQKIDAFIIMDVFCLEILISIHEIGID
jgi:hypothetical protein